MTSCVLAWTNMGMSPQARVRACGRSMHIHGNLSLRNVTLEEAWNSQYYKQLRLDMLSGIKNKNCENCYKQEELGGVSKRLQVNRDSNFNEDHYRHITNIDGSINISPKQLDIRVGHVCNLKCVHCSTGSSSKWYEDKILLDKYENTRNLPIDNDWISDKGNIWKYVRENIDSIESLNVLGGEPFASKPHNQLIDWLIEHDKTHVELSYVTNATLINPKLLDKLKLFKKVTLGISMDAVGPVAEFLRFPNKWSELLDNLSYINQTFSKAYFNWTCYNLNLYHLPNTYNFCTSNFKNIRFSMGNYVSSPSHMSVQNLPLSFKQEIRDRVKEIPNSEFYINYMFEHDLWTTHKITLLSYLNDIDLARKTNWREVLPEIKKLYG